MRQRRHFAEHGLSLTRREPSSLTFSEHRAREAISKRRLADPLGPDQKPGMMHAPRAERVLEFLDRRVVAEHALDLARRRETFEPVGLGGPRAALAHALVRELMGSSD